MMKNKFSIEGMWKGFGMFWALVLVFFLIGIMILLIYLLFMELPLIIRFILGGLLILSIIIAIIFGYWEGNKWK